MYQQYNGMPNNNAELNNMALIPEYEQSKYTQSPNNINQYQTTQNKIIIKNQDCSICPVIVVLCIPFTIISIVLYIVITNFELFPFIIIFSLWVVFLLPIILVLLLLYTKIYIIKDEFNNILKVQKMNSFNCAITSMTFNLKNVIMDIYTYPFHSGKRGTSMIESISIVNTFRDMSEIDLDTSNIKDKPVQLFYIIDRIPKKTYDKESLSKFLGISPDFENPLLFNINQYIGKSHNELLKFGSYKLNKYLKMSDHFYSFYFDESCFFGNFMMLSFPLFPEFILILITIILFSEMSLITKIIFLIVDSLTIIFFIYLFTLFFKIYLRMDIIFSKNFDKVFIALLNRNGSSYKKTFIFDINLIDKFILQPYKDSDNKSFLKVVYKDKNIEELFRIDENRGNLDGLLYILNLKLDGNNNKVNNYISY